MNAGLRTAMAVDGDAARSALTASERQRCASLTGAEQQGNFRAGRLAAKRAAKETLHKHEARIEVVPVAGSGRPSPFWTPRAIRTTRTSWSRSHIATAVQSPQPLP